MNKQEVTDYFREQLRIYKSTSHIFSNKENCWLFIAYCAEYLFFTPDHPATPEAVSQCVTDGSNDQGFDAICTDWNDDKRPIVIIQSKYLGASKLDPTKMLGEIKEIRDRLDEYLQGNLLNITRRIAEQLNNCRKNCLDPESPSYKIIYLTTDNPTAQKKQNIETTLSDDDLEIYYGDEIIGKIESSLTGKRYVSKDFLEIDNPSNFLKFDNGNAAIFNISAKSLKNLFSRHVNGLFGMNLRLFDFKAKKNKVDAGIRKTIEEYPSWFWYLNNGLVIACKDFHVEENENKLVLEEFSIINGCQTTNGINNNRFDSDFFLTCKVVKACTDPSNESAGNRITIQKIAEATNYQKPIKDVNTKANEPEQIRIQDDLRKYGIQYILKVGERRNPAMKRSITMDSLGKYYMAEILQNPAARSNASGLFKENTYEKVYMNMKTSLVPELIEMNDLYNAFQRKASTSEMENASVIKKARTYVIALLCYCSAHFQVQVTANTNTNTRDNDALKAELERLSKEIVKLDSIFVVKPSDQEFESLFRDISEYIVSYCFSSALENDSTTDPNKFLQTNVSYFKMIKRLSAILANNSIIYKQMNELIRKMFTNPL